MAPPTANAAGGHTDFDRAASIKSPNTACRAETFCEF